MDNDQFATLSRVVPAKVSSTDAWRLFDRSVSSGFTPTTAPVTIELDRSEQLVAIKVRGASPYVLDVVGTDGASLGLSSLNLSTLPPGWQMLRASTTSPTTHVELRFRPLGEAKPIPELELWTIADQPPKAAPSTGLTFAASDKFKQLEPGDCTTFAISLDRSPAVFRRTELAYESVGAFRPFVLERSINGRASQGGSWIDGEASQSTTFSEQIDPLQLKLGRNEIQICVPSAATRSVSIADLRVVAELDRGVELATKATVADQRDAGALIDENPDTSTAIAVGERVVLDFDRLIAPDALVLDADITPSSVECIARNGVASGLVAEDLGDAIKLDGGTKACRALAVTFSTAVTLTKLDVIGSGAEEAVDWPRLVVSSAPEHFGKLAWVSGFVAHPAVMNGAIRTDIAGHASEGMTGDFGRVIERKGVMGPWTVDVSAQLPDGSQQFQKVVLTADRSADLVVNQLSSNNATANPNNTHFGKTGDVTAGQASVTASTKIRLGTLVGVDIPGGAVDRPTTIKAKHLDENELPPLDPGMINVTAPKGHGYEFLPHGQQFSKAIEVVLPFDTKLIPQGMSINDVYTYYYDTKARHWKKLQRNAIDLGDHTTRSATNHFTTMIDAVLATPTNPKPLSFDPTALSSIAAASPAANIDFVQPPTANSMGDARLSLPIRIPAGRGSFTPSVSLAYSSAAGNGWVGVGWDMPSPKIEIDTRWGVPSYAANEEPRYVLNGAELVPTLDSDGPTCTNGRRYHTRMEGAFSHILRCGSGPSSYYWQVRDRNGTLFTYGGTATSVLASYRAPNGIYRWNLRDVTDVHGNKTTYSYVVDEIAAGPGPDGQEASRESYLDAIDYTEKLPLAAKYRVELIRDDGNRADRIISGRPGFKVVTRHLLRIVRVKFDSSVIRDYVLTYAQGQFGKSVLANVRVYGTGGCAAALPAFTAPSCSGASFFNEHSFTYFNESDGLVGFGPQTSWSMLNDPDPAKATITKGDSTTKSASVSLGASGSGGSVSASASGTSGERWDLIGFYDVDGDGLPDQIFDTGSGLTVLYNQYNNPTGNKSFSTDGPVISGLAKLNHELSQGWSIDAKAGINPKGFGASASGGYSSSKSSADSILTDLDGDGFIDQISTMGPTLASAPCPSGHCFNVATFDATSSIDPKLDPSLIQAEGEVSERLILGDPVVQWVAPYSGTATIIATGQKRRAGGVDGVTLELWQRVIGSTPTQDTLAASAAIPAGSTAPVTLTLTNISVTAGQQFYMRLRTGDPGIDKTGLLNDEVDAWMGADYLTACTGGSCPAVPSYVDQPHDPTGKPLYSFSQYWDTRVNPRPLALPSNGTVHIKGQLAKTARSAAPIRACLQKFTNGGSSANGSFDVPCSSTTGVSNVSGTYSFMEAAVVTQNFDLWSDVSAGEFLVFRVESDFSIDPSVISLVPAADQSPYVEYTLACTPPLGMPSSCSGDPKRVAQVQVDPSTFGLFVAPVSPPAPFGTVPIATRATWWPSASWSVDFFSNPLYPTAITVTIRSDSRGTLGSFNCTVNCGRIIHGIEGPPIAPFDVYYGESITFEITATNVNAAFQGFMIPGSFGSAGYQVPAFFRLKTAVPEQRTPFADARRGFHVSFWNENETFQPSLLLEDYGLLNTGTPPSDTRLAQMMRSAVEPLPYPNNPVGYPATSPEPTWAGPGSVAFMTPHGHANAADIGVMQGTSSGVASVYGGSYARLSCTRSYYVGVGLQGGGVLQNLAIDGSLNATVSESDTNTTTDVIDLTGDGIADVIAGDNMYVSTLVGGVVKPFGNLNIGNGFRKRTSHDYSFGFGGSGSNPQTTAGGRRRSMSTQDTPKQGYALGGNVGISVGRSQTTQDLVDVNGDGLPDIVNRTGSEITVRYNLGDRFDKPEHFGYLDPALAGDCVSDNSQCIDAFQLFEDTAPVPGSQHLKSNQNALGHDTTITFNNTFTIDLFFASASFSIKDTSSRTTRQLADLNGDGLPDLLFKKASEGVIRVQYNTGGTFGPATTWNTPAWVGEVYPAFPNTSFDNLFSGTRAVGGPDVLASTGTQDSTAFSGSVSIPIFAKLSLGFGASVAYEKDTYELGLVDVTGDGAPDHVLRRGASNDPQYTYVKPNLANGKSNLLKKVTGPLGGTIELAYQLTGPSIDMPHARQTLFTVTVNDNSPTVLEPNYSSPNIVTNFGYEGGYFDRLEKQFLGFRDVLTWRSDGQISEQTYENHDFTMQGMLLRETRSAAEGGALLHKHIITREVRNVVDQNGIGLVPHPDCLNGLHALLRRLTPSTAACTPKFAVVTKDEDISYEGLASKTRTVEHTNFDRFGNLLESLDRADDALTSDDLYATTTYQHDLTSWVLGRPTAVQARAGNASGALLRSRRGLYTTFGDLYQIEVDTGTAPAVATTNLTYDQYGNLETLSTPENETGQRQVYTLTYDPTVKTYVTNSADGFGYQSQSIYDLRFGVATTETDIGGASIVRTLDAFGRLATVKGPYDTQSSDGITLSYFPLENPPRAVSVTQASKPTGSTGTVPGPTTTETIASGFGETIELRRTGVVDQGAAAAVGVITSGLVQKDTVGRVTRVYQPFFTAGTSTGFITPTSTAFVSKQYDTLDRPVLTTYPDSATESVDYTIQNSSTGVALFRAQTTDTDGHQRETFTDQLGLAREFVEHPDTSTSLITKYAYATTGELTQVTDHQNYNTTLGYDLRGLRTSLRNPDTGLITDTYDAMGNRIATQEPNHRKLGVSVTFKYNIDRLERVIYPSKPAIRTCASGLTASVCYEYGSPTGDPVARGRLVRVQDESGWQDHTYGQLGEVRETVRTVAPPSISPVIFDHRYVSDSLGRLLSVRYPDGETILNTYDAAGNLKQVTGATFSRNYASDIRYDVFGNRTHLTYGNNVVSTWTYDNNRVRLSGHTTALPGGRAIQALSYAYSNSGHGNNFASVANNIPNIENEDPTNTPGASTLSFTYDGVDRLLTASGTAKLNAQKSTSYDETFTYSPIHNLLTKQRIRREYQTGTTNYSYDPDSQIDRCSTPPCNAATYSYASNWDAACNGGDSGVRPHLPNQVGASGAGLALQYDCSGNPTTRQKLDTGSTQQLTWDDDNRLVEVQESSAHQTNTYDATGTRVRRASGGGQNNVTIFSSNFFDLEGNTQGLRHVFAGDLRVATEMSAFASSSNPPPPAAPGTEYYFHSDHLGSTTVLTDHLAAVYQSTEYYVDGDEWLDRAPQNVTNQYLFNGKPFDKDTSFYDYGQRFYDPRTSLWLGVDPALTDSPAKAVGRPLILSVGAYAAHRPSMLTDPDGREPPLGGLNGYPDPMSMTINADWGGIKDTLFAPVDFYTEHLQHRVSGAGKMVGGIALVKLGVVVCAASFGLGCGVGAAIGTVGVDLTTTGFIEGVTNQSQQSMIGKTLGPKAQMLQEAAGDAAALIDMLAGGGAFNRGGDTGGGGGGGGGEGPLKTPGHEASFKITRADGTTRTVGNATSGRMSNAEKATRSPSISDTEQRILGTNPLQPGETLEIQGFKAPCKTCQGKMRAASGSVPDTTIKYNYYDDNGKFIEYVYRNGERISP